MVDIALIRNEGKDYYDIGISENGDFVLDEGLDTAFLLSLLSNARANSSEIPIIQERGGWYGNLIWNSEGEEQGSKLWLLFQARLTQPNVLKGKNYSGLALNWLLQQGYINYLDVESIKLDSKTLKIIVFARSSENANLRYDYQIKL